ncbi:unnamed protein product [Paramecium octaurelia]|uniref:Uncharacterized protein n=1 Tax=Paramecium octaurelia TaxID=43137 RepID=A0A8S1WAU6_PAROT|nr:unnamed protein product [Paramecium octaurelia]
MKFRKIQVFGFFSLHTSSIISYMGIDIIQLFLYLQQTSFSIRAQDYLMIKGKLSEFQNQIIIEVRMYDGFVIAFDFRLDNNRNLLILKFSSVSFFFVEITVIFQMFSLEIINSAELG